MEFCEKRLEEIYRQFGADPAQGLSDTAVTHQREQYGRNELRREKRTPWFVVLGRQFTGILIYILGGAALVSGFFGEWIDTIAILAILVINGVIGFIQEWKAQASIAALQRMASSKATVIRNGKAVQVEASELVPGDILVLQTGDRIPADARIFEAASLETAEGALTGESTPVSKKLCEVPTDTPLAEQRNMVFSGTAITKGRGKAVVVATGMKTQIGKIAKLVSDSAVEETPLQQDLDALGSKLGKLTIGISAFIFIFIILYQAHGFTLEALKDPFLLSISLAVAAIPEGLPIVVTVALAFGTQRMVRKNALIKRLASVETLGSTTVICTDKTGTLTKNEMTVTRVWHAGRTIPVTGTGYAPDGAVETHLPNIIAEIGILCNDADLVIEDSAWRVIGDPTEGCLLTLARKMGFNEDELRARRPRLGESPFTSERKRMSTVNDFDGARLLLMKGAPDVVLQHCTRILEGDGVRDLTEADKRSILEANEDYAKEALRVLGFAFKEIGVQQGYGENDERDMIFVSLAGMIDPPREEAKEAVDKCHAAGIRVVMITGDHQVTAAAIAKELGIEGRVITGAELDDIDLDKEVSQIAVYARVNPEHKMMIVEALKRRGEVVAMTGDGVNDAPALKRADIGIAMGIAGTDVAKESASMILTDDNFASIVGAVEEGRQIYTNIKKFVNYLLSSNFAEILVIFFSVLFFTYEGEVAVALTVTMLLLMNILTDSLPALALGVDPGDPLAMSQKPRDPKAHILSENMLVNIVMVGLLVAGASLLMFSWSLRYTGSLAHAQTVALTTLVALQIVRLAMVRKQYNTPFFSNKWLFAALATVFAIQLLVVYTPVGNLVFGTVPLGPVAWILIAGAAAGTYAVGMLVNHFARAVTRERD